MTSYIFTTLNPSDKSATIALSNGNLTMTNTGGTGGTNNYPGARGTLKASLLPPLLYFEATITAVTSGVEDCVGISGFGEPFATIAVDKFNAAILFPNGHIWENGTLRLSTSQTFTNGTPIGVATNITTSEIWFTTTGSGYNSGGTANPATGIGGVSFSDINIGAALFPVGILDAQDTSNIDGPITFNFGQGAFSYTVPAGFTPGWGFLSGGGLWFAA